MFGSVTASEPSLRVEAAKTVGKVCPPSVDSEIFTFAVLIGAIFVFATFQVMVFELFPSHDVPAASSPVMLNGPAVFVTVTVVSVNWVCPIVDPGT